MEGWKDTLFTSSCLYCAENHTQSPRRTGSIDVSEKQTIMALIFYRSSPCPPSVTAASPTYFSLMRECRKTWQAKTSEGIPAFCRKQSLVRLMPVAASRGGLWVGGKAVLTTSTLSFAPNSMNQALHATPENLEISISLTNISNVAVHRGLSTDVIEIRTDVGILKIKCVKAKAFAAAIEATRIAAR